MYYGQLENCQLLVLIYSTFRVALGNELFAQKKKEAVREHSTGTEFLFGYKVYFLKPKGYFN